MNPSLNGYLNKIDDLQKRFPDMEPVAWDKTITPHEWQAKVDYPALECNKVVFGSHDSRGMWWFHLLYRDSYDVHHQSISVMLFRISGYEKDWEDHAQEILKNIELLSENENLPEVEVELALATYRAYDARYPH